MEEFKKSIEILIKEDSRRIEQIVKEDTEKFMCEDLAIKIRRHLNASKFYLTRLEDGIYRKQQIDIEKSREDYCKWTAYSTLFLDAIKLYEVIATDISDYVIKFNDLVYRSENLGHYLITK